MNTLRMLVAVPVLGLLLLPVPANASPKPESYWPVDDVRPGMKGVGKTVIKGTKIEEFDAEILGVLKNTSPGRDLVLARLSGCNLEKTGVIAGMSGSPVYIQGKLLGAVAYAWAYGKEPIAGITPFCQINGRGFPLARSPSTDPPTTSPRSLMARPALLTSPGRVPRSLMPVFLVHRKA